VLKIERIEKEECAGTLPAFLFYLRRCVVSTTTINAKAQCLPVVKASIKEALVESTPLQFTCNDKRRLKLQ
jgi:hypothetical protein